MDPTVMSNDEPSCSPPTGWLLGVCAAAALLLCACGPNPGTSSPNGATSAEQAAGEPATTAIASAKDDGMPPAKCPAKPNTTLTGPDVVGLKLGMSHAEALNLVRCHMPDAGHIESEGSWLRDLNSYQVKLGPQVFTVQAGDSKPCNYNFERSISGRGCGAGGLTWDHIKESITVAAPGIPGRETVVSVWRQQQFKTGEMPPVAAAVESLVKKYGAPQYQQDNNNRSGYESGSVELRWASDMSGAPLTEPNPLYNQCLDGGTGAGGSSRWTEGCGLNVFARVSKSGENPDLAREIQVGLMHQDKLYQFGIALQGELDAMEAARRGKELEGAKQAADVKL